MHVCVNMYIHKHIYVYTLYVGVHGSSVVKNLPANAGDVGSIPGSEDSLEEEMATHASILAWRISWAKELGWLQSTGSQRSWTQLSD